MNGVIVLINATADLAALKTGENRHSIIEVKANAIELGDDIRWNGGYPFGTQFIRDHTKSTDIEVYFRIHSVGDGDLKKELLME